MAISSTPISSTPNSHFVYIKIPIWSTPIWSTPTSSTTILVECPKSSTFVYFRLLQLLIIKIPITIKVSVEHQQFPAVYALLPNKSRATYNLFFTLLKEVLQNLGITLRPGNVLVGFEMALLQSVQLHFPDTDVKGCYFHFSQCLWRWVQNNSHVVVYREDENFKAFVKSAAALAFLPPQTARLAWSTFKLNMSDSAPAEAFSQYFSL